MKLLFSVLLFIPIAQAQEVGHGAKFVKNLREDCVAAERVSVAVDTNDFSHLKTDDNLAAGYCEGFVSGFIVGSNHEPIGSIRHLRKTIVAYIDDHPNEIDLRTIMSAALKDDGK